MSTLSGIRVDNLYLLMAASSEQTITALSVKTGISRGTLSPVMNRTKNLSNDNARKAEAAHNKKFGWLDEVHESILETDDSYDPEALSCAVSCIFSSGVITSFFNDLNEKGKGSLMDKLYLLFTDPAARELSTESIYAILGVGNGNKKNKTSNNGKTTGTKANIKE